MEILACYRSNQMSINPNDRPYILRFFTNGRIEPYVIGYCILVVSILVTFPLLKLKQLHLASSHRQHACIREFHKRRFRFLEGSVRDSFSNDL
jgi:hypothetical protein